MSDPRPHWEQVYRTKSFDAVSWYTPHLAQSLQHITALAPNKDAAIIDVGGGESTLVDDLLDQGYQRLSVLDISAAAIEFTQKRLGARASQVHWYAANITQADFGGRLFDLWHDRAVFHFLTEAADRAAYVERLHGAVQPGGHVVMATFGPQGPLKCSGLEVVRYDATTLHQTLGDGFTLLGSDIAVHDTPMGTQQQFSYAWFRKE